MKTINIKRIAALLLSLAVILPLLLQGTAAGSADAAALPLNSLIIAHDINDGSVPNYSTPDAYASKEFSYKIRMPEAGILILWYVGRNSLGEVNENVSESVSGLGATLRRSSSSSSGRQVREYAVGEAGDLDVSFSLESPNVYTRIEFAACYAPYVIDRFKVSNGSFTEYIQGGMGDNATISTFKVTVPSKGKLKLNLADANGNSIVYMKADGFGGYEAVTSKNTSRWIGVKKGTYTFRVKSSAPVYKLGAGFYKVSESKYGLKKSTAVRIYKNSLRRGLIVTNSKKIHWYKFKNPKLQKASVVIRTSINGGGNKGGIRVTIYNKKGPIKSRIIYPKAETTTINLYTPGKKSKLARGTYRIKVESYKSGNGYFTVKWK